MEHKEAWNEQNEGPSKDVVWSPPPKSWIKLNFDAAIHEEKTKVAIVGRDIASNLLLACMECHWAAKKVICSPALEYQIYFWKYLYFANCFSNVEFSFVHRKGKIFAHLLAWWTALINLSGPILISNLHSHVSQAIVRDGSRLDLFVSPLFRIEFF